MAIPTAIWPTHGYDRITPPDPSSTMLEFPDLARQRAQYVGGGFRHRPGWRTAWRAIFPRIRLARRRPRPVDG